MGQRLARFFTTILSWTSFRLRFNVVVCFFITTFSSSMAAKDAESIAINANELSITYKGSTQLIFEYGEILDPLELCRTLNELLNNQKSGAIYRPFKGSECSGGIANNSMKQGQWRLEIDAQSQNIRLRLLYQWQEGMPPAEQAVVTFPENPKLDELNLQLVLTELFDQSPMLARINDPLVFTASKPAKISFPCQATVRINPPSEVFVYQLRWSKQLKVFQPVFIASGKIDKSNECPTWDLAPTGLKPKPGETIFLHSKMGRGKAGYMKTISFNSAKEASKKPLSGIAGISYSHPTEKDSQTGMLAKTKIFSLLAELRSGKLKGLRTYIDYMPKAQGIVSSTGGKTNISFQRYVFGYAFAAKPWGPKIRFDAIPKLGIWNLRSKLPLYPDDTSTPPEILPFDLKYKPASTIDFDVEYEPFYNFVMRGYVALGIGLGISQDKNQTLVTSQRFGADIIWSPKPATPKFPYKIGYIGSVFKETNTLKRVDVPQDPNEPYIGTFSFHQTYLSGGVVVAW